MTSSSATDASAGAATRENLGFLLAKASQRWNELLYQRFAAAGYPDVRPSYGSVLVPLFEEDGLRMGELAARARLSKQTITTIVRLLERDGLVERLPDASDGRAALVFLTERARRFRPVAETTLAELDALVVRALTAPGRDELRDALRALETGVGPTQRKVGDFHRFVRPQANPIRALRRRTTYEGRQLFLTPRAGTGPLSRF
jgi:DNA-binding MarR family transcriptional regulator